MLAAIMSTHGVRCAAAAAYGLDFMLIMRDQYYPACLKASLEQAAVKRLMDLLRREGWKEAIADLPGYDSAGAGEVQPLKAAFPWYSFTGKKPGARRLTLGSCAAGIPGRAAPGLSAAAGRAGRGPGGAVADPGLYEERPWICGEPAWDADSHCPDLFLMLSMARLEHRYARHYLRNDAALAAA